MLRLAAVLLTAAFGVHELRYLLAYGDDAQRTLAYSGHGYLSAVAGVLGLLIAVALAGGVLRAARARPRQSTISVRARTVWPRATAALLVIYTSQELVEGMLSPGHPAGLPGVLGGGGWLVVPLAALGGAAVTACVQVARLAERSRPGIVLPPVWHVLGAAAVPRFAAEPRAFPSGRLLASNLAGRGPPPLPRPH